jgi:hypothetical protein
MIALQETYNDVYYKCVNVYYDTEYHIGRWKSYVGDLINGYVLSNNTNIIKQNSRFNFKHSITHSGVSWTHVICEEQDFLELMADHISVEASSLLDIMLKTSYYRDKGKIYYSLYYDTRNVPVILVFCMLDDKCLFFHDSGIDEDLKANLLYVTQRKIAQFLSIDIFHIIICKENESWQSILKKNGYKMYGKEDEHILMVKIR